MKKIRLEIEHLDVQSFVTAAAATARGTVQGAEGGVVGEPDRSKPPVCYIESGNCVASRFDDLCDTVWCLTPHCEIESGQPCVIFTGEGCDIGTLVPNC